MRPLNLPIFVNLAHKFLVFYVPIYVNLINEKYKRNTDKIEKFYGKVLEETHGICMRLYVYSLEYARYIMDSDKSFGEKYDDFEELIKPLQEEHEKKLEKQNND